MTAGRFIPLSELVTLAKAREAMDAPIALALDASQVFERLTKLGYDVFEIRRQMAKVMVFFI